MRRIAPIFVLSLAALGFGCTEGDQSAPFACLTTTDCLAGHVCVMRDSPYAYGACLEASVASGCTNGALDGDETAVDCGGSCPPCTPPCSGAACTSNTCANGVQDAGESGVDCGGTCGPCPAGTACKDGSECGSGVCTAGVCDGDGDCYKIGAGVWRGPGCSCAVCDPATTCDTDTDTLKCRCDADIADDVCDACGPVDAGESQYLPGKDLAILAATPGEDGKGTWSVAETRPPGKAGTGAFGDANDPTTTFEGLPGVLYLVDWSVQTACGPKTGRLMIDFDPCSGERALRDPRDARMYAIGPHESVCWMHENLGVGEMIFADADPEQVPGDDGKIQKYCFGDVPAGCDAPYGALYTWHEAIAHGGNAVVGICPDGWELPQVADYADLVGAFTESYDLLAVGETGPARDTIGWQGRLAGRHDAMGSFANRGDYGYHWTAACPNTAMCPSFKLFHSGELSLEYPNGASQALAVRCIRR